jgi:hypothetical protein
VDPLTSSYPWYTPYQFASNTPIQAIDLDGLESFGVATNASVRYAYSMTQNNRPPSAGTIGYYRWNPISRNNRYKEEHFETSRTPGGSIRSDPTFTKDNKSGQHMNDQIAGFYTLLEFLKDVKVNSRTARQYDGRYKSMIEYTFTFISNEAKEEYEKKQSEYEFEYNQRAALVKIPADLNSNASNEEKEQWNLNWTVYSLNMSLIKIDMGPSPREILIQGFENGKGSNFELLESYEEQIPQIIQGGGL